MRLKFINRGFDNAYYEMGVANGNSISIPGESTYIDQSTLGLKLGQAFFDDGDGYYHHTEGYLVYPEGHREQAQFYATGDTFTNNGLGTMYDPATYIAEPYTQWLPSDSMYKYYEFDFCHRLKEDAIVDGGLWISFIKEYHEHMYYDGKDEPRTYFKKTVIPDGIPTDMPENLPDISSYASIWASSGAPDAGITTGLGIAFTNELELIIGNEYYYRTGEYSFRDNAALQKLEHFPHLGEISRYAFMNCENLLPMQEWEGVDNVREISNYAFMNCFQKPSIDSNHNVSRRTFILPDSLKLMGSYVFKHAVYTDFTIDGEGLETLSQDSFAYSDSDEHSADFQSLLADYNAASAQDKPLLVPSLKAVANHVTFLGSEEEYETLTGVNYDELAVLLAKEYYVTFTE